MQVRVLSTLRNGVEALVDEHVLCKHEVVDSSSTNSTKGIKCAVTSGMISTTALFRRFA